MSQRLLNLNDPRYRRPTMQIGAVKGILDIGEDEVIALIEEGSLVAWNIALPGAERRELRVLTQTVALAQARMVSSGSARSGAQLITEKETFTLLFPHAKPFVTGTEAQRMLNCGSTHVIRLVNEGCLEQCKGSKYRRGPNGSPAITRESFEGFLRERVEC